MDPGCSIPRTFWRRHNVYYGARPGASSHRSVSRTSDTWPFPGDDSGGEIYQILDAALILCRAITVNDQAVSDVGDYEDVDDFREAFGWKIMFEMWQASQDAAALAREDTHVGVPREMLIKEYSKVFGFSSGVQRSTAEVNREGRKRGKILSSSAGEMFEFCL